MTDKLFVHGLTISLVTHNGQRWLPYCLESLAKQTYQDFFLLIIDNGSLDNTVSIIKEFLKNNSDLEKRSRLIQHKSNLGFAKAHNQALAWTSSPYVCLLNQDVKLLPDYLSELVEQLKKQPAVAAVTGCLRRWFLSPAESGLETTTETKEYLDSTGLIIKRTRQVEDRGASEVDKGQYLKSGLIFGVSGAAPIYKRSALQAVAVGREVLDEDFFSYKEDVDLAWRLQRAGYSALYWPKALAYHDRNLSPRHSLKNLRYSRNSRPAILRVYSWTNHLFVLFKNDGWFNLLRDMPWWGGYELIKFLYLMVLEPAVFKKAFLRLISLTPVMLKKRQVLKTSWQRPASQIRGWWLK